MKIINLSFACGAYKKYALSAGLSIALSLFSSLILAAAFTPGSIVVYRVGNGSTTALSSSAALPVYLDEYSPSGVLLQSVAMPTAAGTAPLTNPLTASNTASEGMLKRSVNGQCLTVTGYAAASGTVGIAATASTAVQREVAFVSASAGANTTTTLGTTAISASNIRGAVSNDCAEAWVSGNGGATANKGIWYAASVGATTSTQIETSPVTSQGIDITTLTGGSMQLYASASGFSRIGSGLPTSAGSVTSISPFPTGDNYRGLTFLQLNSSSTGTDTVYVADNSANTVAKYSYNGSSWTAVGSFSTTTLLLPPNNTANSGFNVTGLNAVNLGDGEVAVYFTDAKNGYIYRVIDTSGYGGTLSSSPTISLFATATGAPTYAVYYGLAPAPESSLPTSAPDAATDASAASITSTGFTANWTAPASGAAVSYYVVDVSADDFLTVSQTIIVPASQTSANISGLTASTNYFRVRALNSFGASADSNSGPVAVPGTSQSITFGPPPSITAGFTGTVSAAGGPSGNPVIFSSLTTDICTVSGTNGSTVTGIAAGTCTIAADQAGNATYNAATEVTQSFTITAAPLAQTIVFDPAPAIVYGGTGTVSATGGGSGNPIIFTSTTTGVCTVSGTNGSTVTGVAAGTCIIAADQAGNTSYIAAPEVTQNITIAAANQTIAFGKLPALVVGSTDTVSATGGATGNPVTFSSNTTGVCTVSGNTVTGVASGTCTIAADQAGNANYSEATATLSITVANSITAFTAGDLVISTVSSVNNGGLNLDTAAPIVLQEFQLGAGDTSATLAGALILPQTSSGSNSMISGEFGSASEGILQQSVDGQYLTMMGYGVNAESFNSASPTIYGTAALGQTTSLTADNQTGTAVTTVPRVVALIGADASVDTSTALTGVYNTNNPRSVTSVDGTSFYTSGQGASKTDPTQGVAYAALGATTATTIDNSTDTRVVSIINNGSENTLYVSRDQSPPSGGIKDNTNVDTLTDAGGSLPTSAAGLIDAQIVPPASPFSLGGNNASINLTSGTANGVNNSRIGNFVYLSPEQYFMASPTVMYVADSGQPKNGNADAAALGEGGLQKWVLTDGSWTLAYVLVNGLNLVDNATANASTPTAPGVTGLLGLTGKVVDGQVQLFATSYGLNELSQSYLYEITDDLSATSISQVSGEQFTTLYTDPTGQTSIRGVAFAPVSQTLSYSTETGYGTAGVNPSSGTTSTSFTFKVVYTNAANAAPSFVAVCIDALPCSPMSVDVSAAAALHDGNYDNGEQYAYSTTLAAGAHTYYFTAFEGTDGVDLPASGTLSGPTVVAPLVISTSSLPDATGGISYSQTLAATGGMAPYSWSISGSLPAGLSLNPSTGAITGTPTAVGSSSFSVSVTDADSTVVSKLLSITVDPNVDLTVSALSSPSVGGSVNSGRSITINYTVANIGSTVTTAAIVVGFYLSTDATITTSDVMIGSRRIRDLAGGASGSGSISVIVPYTLKPGTYYIGAIVNPSEAQVETNYSNNSRATAGTFTVVGNVDLTVSALGSPSIGGSVKAGSSITINDTVTNGGTSPTTTSVAVAYYLSTNATITTSDMLIGSRSVPIMAGGTSNSGTTALSLPLSLAPGAYHIGAIVNPNHAQLESNYFNNSRATAGIFTVVHNANSKLAR